MILDLIEEGGNLPRCGVQGSWLREDANIGKHCEIKKCKGSRTGSQMTNPILVPKCYRIRICHIKVRTESWHVSVQSPFMSVEYVVDQVAVVWYNIVSLIWWNWCSVLGLLVRSTGVAFGLSQKDWWSIWVLWQTLHVFVEQQFPDRSTDTTDICFPRRVLTWAMDLGLDYGWPKSNH